ncbi:hypothetical protein HHI36_005922, partial [Cryptolaemus montrouzieri]
TQKLNKIEIDLSTLGNIEEKTDSSTPKEDKNYEAWTEVTYKNNRRKRADLKPSSPNSHSSSSTALV